MLRMIMKTPDQGGDTLVAAALDPTLEDSKVKQMIFGVDLLPLCNNHIYCQEFIHQGALLHKLIESKFTKIDPSVFAGDIFYTTIII